jgi:hypothetical protein
MKNDNARDTFEKVGDYDDVENVSGADWEGAEAVLRPRTITPPRPGRAMSPRTQTMINAQSGETLGTELERAAARAARRIALEKMIDQAPAGREMLRHLFGLNLPGRDRA